MNILKEFFSWSKKERTGVLLLSLFVMFLFLGDVFFERIYPFNDYLIHPDTLVLYKSILDELERELETSENVFSKEESKKEKAINKISNFDPNQLDISGWMKLGFSEKQSLALINYRESLGGFKKESDLSESFVVSDSKFKELLPFIRIKDRLNNDSKEELLNSDELREKEFPVEVSLYIELNSSDSTSLLQLKGIGPFYAGKIIEYRNRLGGYLFKEQLLELWKFDSSKLNSIMDQIWVDTNKVRYLRINSDSLNFLKKHPYLDWNHANAIVSYREQHGSFNDKEELKKLVIFNDSLIHRLYPYLKLE